jgi:hypothetical protein
MLILKNKKQLITSKTQESTDPVLQVATTWSPNKTPSEILNWPFVTSPGLPHDFPETTIEKTSQTFKMTE